MFASIVPSIIYIFFVYKFHTLLLIAHDLFSTPFLANKSNSTIFFSVRLSFQSSFFLSVRSFSYAFFVGLVFFFLRMSFFSSDFLVGRGFFWFRFFFNLLHPIRTIRDVSVVQGRKKKESPTWRKKSVKKARKKGDKETKSTRKERQKKKEI